MVNLKENQYYFQIGNYKAIKRLSRKYFNIIQHSKLINFKIDNSNILDMYSGVGSFGLEALSRGAKKVAFIEKDENTLKILETNVINLSLSSSRIN